MNFWNMQLHPNDKKEFGLNDFNSVLTNSVIGMGDKWENDGGQPSHFRSNAQIGDIVLLRYNGPKVLVEIVGDCEDNSNSNIWFSIVRRIKVLSTIGEEIKLEFEKSKNNWQEGLFNGKTFINANNSIFIKFWYDKIKNQNMNIINLLEYKKQIILQGPPGTGKTFTAKDIAFQIIFDKPIDETNRKDELELLKNSKQFELIQFHPAYTYEDFVRGIVVESSEGSSSPTYTTKNKVLAEIAQKALENKQNSEKDIEIIKNEANFETLFDDFVASIEEELEKNDKVTINKTAYITEVEEMQFRYTADNWNTAKDSIMKFNDIKNIYKGVFIEKKEFKTLENISKTAKREKAYSLKVAEQFKEFVDKTNKPVTENTTTEPLKKYVLIIDEINRANLPAVLGELIYALEYRNEPVETMYDIDGNRKITLPSNLYIIGTMNTADRSVGHIDYAIRRRFAFVDVPANRDIIPEAAKQLFDSVKTIFEDYKTDDFELNDIEIGHSYYMKDELELSLEYEIKPLLREYVKDGILKSEAKDAIENLKL